MCLWSLDVTDEGTRQTRMTINQKPQSTKDDKGGKESRNKSRVLVRSPPPPEKPGMQLVYDGFRLIAGKASGRKKPIWYGLYVTFYVGTKNI